MSTACLKQSFRFYSGPVLFLTVVCLVMGAVFLSVGATMGGVFIAAGLVALGVFTLLGARDGCPRCHTRSLHSAKTQV